MGKKCFFLTFTLLLLASVVSAQSDTLKINSPDTVRVLRIKAEALLDSSRVEEATSLQYEILKLDSVNYDANAWLGNYFYLKGQEKDNEEDKRFSEITSPVRMQTAQHMENLKEIYRDYFAKSEIYVKKALAKRGNDHLQMLLKSIDEYRMQTEIVPSEKKHGKK